jgi:hypothetical protein
MGETRPQPYGATSLLYSNSSPSYPVPYKAFTVNKAPPGWGFWEVIYRAHPILLQAGIAFPAPIVGVIGIAIDPQREVYGWESKDSFLEAQRRHLSNVIGSISPLNPIIAPAFPAFRDWPLLLVFLRYDEEPSSLEELLGKYNMDAPHVQVVNYQRTEVEQFIPVFWEFLESLGP